MKANIRRGSALLAVIDIDQIPVAGSRVIFRTQFPYKGVKAGAKSWFDMAPAASSEDQVIYDFSGENAEVDIEVAPGGQTWDHFPGYEVQDDIETH